MIFCFYFHFKEFSFCVFYFWSEHDYHLIFYNILPFFSVLLYQFLWFLFPYQTYLSPTYFMHRPFIKFTVMYFNIIFLFLNSIVLVLKFIWAYAVYTFLHPMKEQNKVRWSTLYKAFGYLDLLHNLVENKTMKRDWKVSSLVESRVLPYWWTMKMSSYCIAQRK